MQSKLPISVITAYTATQPVADPLINSIIYTCIANVRRVHGEQVRKAECL